jgi:hypothetical protein
MPGMAIKKNSFPKKMAVKSQIRRPKVRSPHKVKIRKKRVALKIPITIR